MSAIILAFAAAVFLGVALVLTQFGLRSVAPIAGAAISVPSFTIVFLCLSPLLLRGETIMWSAVPIFIGVGLVFPAVLTVVNFESNRLLGPVVTGALGNLTPLFAVSLAVLLLGEPLRPLQLVGLVVIIAGVVIITVTRVQDVRNWRSWVLLLPTCGAALRGFVQPVIKLGLEIWPNPIAAALTGYIVSALVLVAFARIRTGRFVAQAPLSGKLWFAGVGICNGVAVILMYTALISGSVTLVAPVIATYPLITVGLGTLILGRTAGAARLAVATAITVVGVILLLVG